jgi:hypothetical protein
MTVVLRTVVLVVMPDLDLEDCRRRSWSLVIPMNFSPNHDSM